MAQFTTETVLDWYDGKITIETNTVRANTEDGAKQIAAETYDHLWELGVINGMSITAERDDLPPCL